MNNVSTCQVLSCNGLGFMIFWRTELIKHEGVYITASATTGPIIIKFLKNIAKKKKEEEILIRKKQE